MTCHDYKLVISYPSEFYNHSITTWLSETEFNPLHVKYLLTQ